MSPFALQEGVASLSRGAYFREASLDMTLSILTESAARMAGVARASIWALTDDQRELRCLDLFELNSGRHSRGETLGADRYPAYFRALSRESCIAADDARQHPLTAEFAADYLPRHGIVAMLGSTIHIRGELQGVFCLEQVGSPVSWTAEHRLFALAVANLVTLALVEYEATEARQQVTEARERLQAVFAASRDAMLLADGDSGLILDANQRAEQLFGRSRDEMLGKHQQWLHPEARKGSAGGLFREVVAGRVTAPQVTEIERGDGSVRPVEITTEVADLSDGSRLALGIFRPV